MAVRYRRSARHFGSELKDFPKRDLMQDRRPDFSQLTLRSNNPKAGLSCDVLWRVQTGNPLLRWKTILKNNGSLPVEIDQIDMLIVGPQTGQRTATLNRILPFLTANETADLGSLRPDPAPGNLFFFSNGWQSWSFCGSLLQGEKQPRTRMGPITRPILENPSTPRARGGAHFSSDMFAVLGHQQNGGALLVGALSEKQAFASVEARLDQFSPGMRVSAHGDRAILNPGGSFETDWFGLQFIDSRRPDPMIDYLEAVASENNALRSHRPPSGWSSWYYHFGGVTQSDLMEALSWIDDHSDRLPLDLVQLDDGYQAEIGDWDRISDRFPDGPPYLARAIQEHGLTPGLWIAPLVAKPRARTIRRRPHWVLRRGAGTPSSAGYSWDTFVLGLDPTEPGALSHIQDVIHNAVQQWGFRYLKLDFLYGGALRGRRHNRELTRAAALRQVYRAIRQAAGEDTFLLGCGSPLGPAVGIFDAMRVGPDVAPRWKPSYRGIQTWFGYEPSLPSVRNAVRNTLTRSALNQRWWINDPDCLILRGSDTHLTLPEAQTLATVVSLSGGSVIDSDHLPSMSGERIAMLASLLPPLQGRLEVRDLFQRAYPENLVLAQSGAVGEWWLVARLNWEDTAQVVVLDLSDLDPDYTGEYKGVDFWRAEVVRTCHRRLEREIPAHGVSLLAVRTGAERQAAWLGDTLHVSQGSQVIEWDSDGQGVRARLELGRTAGGHVWLDLPGKPTGAFQDGQPVPFSLDSDSTLHMEINVEYGTTLAIEYQTDSGAGESGT